MKKFKIINFILAVLIILSPINSYAASGKYTISSNSSVEVGNTISVTFKISASKLFYWQAYITYDTSKLELVSGSTNFQGEADDASKGQSSVTKTLKFKAKKTGTANVSIAMGSKDNNINTDAGEISFSKVSKNITIKEKKVVTYSSNNNLKNLSIDGYKLSPSFNKNTLEYTVDLPSDVEQITINASKEDSSSKVSGTGKIKVSEGLNKLSVKVTAENGNTKTYIIKATVKEQDPIELSINQEKYTVIRKKELLPKANSTYTETTTKINEIDVPALTSEITKYTLVGLKDKDGNIGLYIYDSKNNSYLKYNEITFNKLTIVPLEDNTIEIPKGYGKTTLKINDKDVTCYTYKNNYPIFIGLNTETGEKNLYSYDKEENTIQKFIINLNNSNSIGQTLTNNISKEANNDLDTYIIIALGGILIVTYAVILINLVKKSKK